ncbi:hypothetical protein N7510_010999 [Penicillium lagena]|uniref:uncharacterized protein n=1 Tax=Penicillium lagena TaxID=94218 RepID=UPI002540896D|nr:uncharacterized protein N7510_010999 [Penicillium lagena]KAJ5601465.1 hypothetical protein N7510_010999 [Penicillium lagena]
MAITAVITATDTTETARDRAPHTDLTDTTEIAIGTVMTETVSASETALADGTKNPRNPCSPNRGELAEGWYDPATLDKARKSAAEQPMPGPSRGRAASPDGTKGGTEAPEHPADEDNEDEDYGPALPHSGFEVGQFAHLVAESAVEDAIAARDESRQQHRAEIRSHKSAVRNLEDEIAPRAEPGTRERQLEKRREAAAANKAFAEARGGSPEGARDEELMGAGDNDLASLRKEKENEKRKKNEREIRREEILRARAAERDERVQKYREKEQETMGWLQALAKQRFG